MKGFISLEKNGYFLKIFHDLIGNSNEPMTISFFGKYYLIVMLIIIK